MQLISSCLIQKILTKEYCCWTIVHNFPAAIRVFLEPAIPGAKLFQTPSRWNKLHSKLHEYQTHVYHKKPEIGLLEIYGWHDEIVERTPRYTSGVFGRQGLFSDVSSQFSALSSQ